MSFSAAKAYLLEHGVAPKKIHEFEVSSATVELAAEALGVAPARIAKSLSLIVEGAPVLVVAAGDSKIDNKKYKEQFRTKASMLPRERVEELIGHGVGGVCPFGVCSGVGIWLDVSLLRFETVFPACGSANSAVELTPEELAGISGSLGWIDVCREME